MTIKIRHKGREEEVKAIDDFIKKREEGKLSKSTGEDLDKKDKDKKIKDVKPHKEDKPVKEDKSDK